MDKSGDEKPSPEVIEVLRKVAASYRQSMSLLAALSSGANASQGKPDSQAGMIDVANLMATYPQTWANVWREVMSMPLRGASQGPRALPCPPHQQWENEAIRGDAIFASLRSPLT